MSAEASTVYHIVPGINNHRLIGEILNRLHLCNSRTNIETPSVFATIGLNGPNKVVVTVFQFCGLLDSGCDPNCQVHYFVRHPFIGPSLIPGSPKNSFCDYAGVISMVLNADHNIAYDMFNAALERGVNAVS